MPLIVNGQRVDDAVLGAEFSSIKSYFERMGNVSCCERDDEFRGYAKDNIIARILLSQKALEAMPPPPEDQVSAAFEKLKQEHGGESQFYFAVGASPDQADLIRRDIATNLRVENMIGQLVKDEPPPTDAQLRELYEKQIQLFMSPEEVRASHISKAPPRGEKRQEVYDLFREIRRQLLAGADFDELARQHSDRGHEQIDLGFFRHGDLPEEFEMVSFSMNIGEISPVFPSMVGYHIVKVTDRKPSVAKPFEEVKDQVRQLYVDQRKQERVRVLVDELKKEATIEEVKAVPAAASM